MRKIGIGIIGGLILVNLGKNYFDRKRETHSLESSLKKVYSIPSLEMNPIYVEEWIEAKSKKGYSSRDDIIRINIDRDLEFKDNKNYLNIKNKK